LANRLTKICTRSGDSGETGLADGSRVGKDTPRIAAIGDVDELNSWLGLLAAQELTTEEAALLLETQNLLFDLGGELAIPGDTVITESVVEQLEKHIEKFNAALPPLKDFVLPGGNRESAHCHLARTVCRRAERCLLGLARKESVNPTSLIFLNRLSDLLFVMARTLARRNGGEEIIWQQSTGPDHA